MLWDPGSVKKDEAEGRDNTPVTPILVPLQNKPPSVEKTVPVLVPDVQELKDQFQQQQNMLTQIKETLIENESQLCSKEKQVEVYANKLSQIRARSKNSQAKKSTGVPHPGSPKMQKKTSKENLAKLETPESDKTPGNSSKNRKGKVSELRKCLEENKIKFEQRTGKELSEAKKIETIVEQLKMQLEERDKTIQDLQKTIEEPIPKHESLSKPKAKQKESVASKTTQTTRIQPSEDSIEVIALQNKILELEGNVLDLQENLKEKESVIEARTQAVTLLSQDLSLKGKNTLESLEETRQEMRAMQNNFVAMEDQLRRDLRERESRLEKLDEKCKKLESINFELCLKNAEQQEKLANLEAKYLEAEAERKSLKESAVQGQPGDKSDELTKKINSLTKELDDRNKAMIKMKIEHKNKVKNLNKTLDTLKGVSEEKAEIVRLRGFIEELEIVKTGLENRVAELEDEKASEKKLKDQINELEITIKRQNEDLSRQVKTIERLEKENSDLLKANVEKTVLVEKLEARMMAAKGEEEEAERRSREMSQRLEKMEAEYSRRVEELKGEHRKEMEMLESYYGARGEGLDKKALEEYRISSEMNNIHVEEQIELLIREKQQLLEKLKSLSGVSSTDSLTFEKMEHSDLRDGRDESFPLGEEVDLTAHHTPIDRSFHLEKIVSDQQLMINDLQKALGEEREKVEAYRRRIAELEAAMKDLEDANLAFKQQIEMTEAKEPSGKSTKTNTNTKNRIKKIEMELEESKRTVMEQSERVNELSQKLREKEELIEKYTEKIELFERDDWDRENHWKNAEDDIASVQELQKKCLSLENSLFELNEDCERLRKENIEVVHLLSEEKVKRKKLLEELERKTEANDAAQPEVEERLKRMSRALENLEEEIERMESNHNFDEGGDPEKPHWEVADLQEKLEWTNVVLTSKETEIFRLQNLLEDRNSLIEGLEMDLKESKKELAEREKKLGEIIEELKRKEAQIAEISANFNKLQESVDVANQKTATNESQLKELLATVKEMEGDVFKKETELQEIKGILAEKNLDMTNLRNRLEEVNSDLTYSYQEHLENMGKCLRDKESDYEALLAEKNHLEEMVRALVQEKEEAHNEKLEAGREREKLEGVLREKEKEVAEIRENLERLEKGGEKGKSKEEVEDLKLKVRKLAANLKKKAQTEADLSKRVKELEELVSEKEEREEGLKGEVREVTEKWAKERMEKEELEKQVEGFRIAHEQQIQELGAQVQALQEACKRLQEVEKEDKGKIQHLEGTAAELCQMYQETRSVLEKSQEDAAKEKAVLLGKLAELAAQHEELKLRLVEMEKLQEEILTEKSSLDAKIQEKLAVIESLEAEGRKARDQLKVVEEKFFHSEERRLSLEGKNEEMWKKMVENSENLTTIDDLSGRVDELLRAEKVLKESVRTLEGSNAEMKLALDLAQREKSEMEKEARGFAEKVAEVGEELKEMRSAEGEKNALIAELRAEVERLKAENKQLASEFGKLNQDYEQFENDFKENLENSQNVEKSLRHRVEELLSENAALTEKCNLLADEKHQSETREEEDGKKPRKRKSVTFRTDEVEYIKDLKNQLHEYDAKLKEAREEAERLKGELLRERLRHEVSDVVAEAAVKAENLRGSPEEEEGPGGQEVVERARAPGLLGGSPEERKFDAAAFFGSEGEEPFLGGKPPDSQQGTELESLMWDDGWGAEGHLEAEYLEGKVSGEKPGEEYEARVKSLEAEVKSLEEKNERLERELQEQTTKYAKAIKKLKEVKVAHDKLLSEVNRLKSSSGFGDLDAAIVDELKSQIEIMEAKERELVKNLENSRLEKESLLKRIDTLNAGNEKFLEMKERQDNEVEIWQRKNKELLKEIADLRQEVQNPRVLDDSALMGENRELRNRVEALEWKNCELRELLEEKEELLEGGGRTSDVERVMREKSELQKEIEELNHVRELLERKLSEEEEKSTTAIGELSEQLNALASENETLQDILGEMKKSADAAKKGESRIFDYFKSSPGDDLFQGVGTSAKPSNDLREDPKEEEPKTCERCKEVEELKSRLSEAETAILSREEQLNQLQAEREGEVTSLRQSVAELEDLIRLKDSENSRIKESAECERRGLMERLQELESRRGGDQFETIDLNQGGPENDGAILRQRILDLEALLGQREEELEGLRETKEKEAEGLRMEVFRLEDAVRVREEEVRRLQEVGNEVEILRRQVHDLEEFARFKESELRQVQAVKESEVQSLSLRLLEMEEVLRGGGGQGRVTELENLLRFKEEETRQKAAEIEILGRRVADLESLIPVKEAEIQQLVTRANELEKSYNDSKLEIERLLNEEKLNVEEKFVEPFQENMKIPVAFEVEALSRTLEEEKQKCENFQYELSERESLLTAKNGEIEMLKRTLGEMKEKLEGFQEVETRREATAEESRQAKAQLEKMVSDLQMELENSGFQLSVARRELEEFQNVKDEAMENLKSQLLALETELMERREMERGEVESLRRELSEKTKYYEEMIKEKREEEERTRELVRELEKSKTGLEKEVDVLKTELERKEKDIEALAEELREERRRLGEVTEALETREREVADLRETLAHLQEEMSHFRNFEKQVKELRVAQIKEAGAEVSVTPEGHPDLSDWTENELAELSARLQSDLDTALYMLHQRDVRCDELTFELMQLLEERDTLQLRLSTALRINEELRSQNQSGKSLGLRESKDLVDQSSDRQGETPRAGSEDLRQLASKISELHSVSYLRDKTVKDDSLQRHKEQMNLLSRVSDSDITLSRDVQSSPAVLLNWMRGKTTPKVMHI